MLLLRLGAVALRCCVVYPLLLALLLASFAAAYAIDKFCETREWLRQKNLITLTST